ncbi:hypothetical protein BPTFM16_00187 [Altererythrobacter insulae]|nr:hypothetical protein BPTFM16_00187 [Altererythrobacter insulae]
MILPEVLALGAGIATEIIERTSSTPNTLRALQLSLAPAFLLVGIGSIMNVMMQRLTWVAGRIERLAEQGEDNQTAKLRTELRWLRARRQLARRAIMFSTAAGVVISVVIAVLFTSVYIETRIGTVVATLWVATMILLITGLMHFLRETLLAARGPREEK